MHYYAEGSMSNILGIVRKYHRVRVSLRSQEVAASSTDDRRTACSAASRRISFNECRNIHETTIHRRTAGKAHPYWHLPTTPIIEIPVLRLAVQRFRTFQCAR